MRWDKKMYDGIWKTTKECEWDLMNLKVLREYDCVQRYVNMYESEWWFWKIQEGIRSGMISYEGVRMHMEIYKGVWRYERESEEVWRCVKVHKAIRWSKSLYEWVCKRMDEYKGLWRHEMEYEGVWRCRKLWRETDQNNDCACVGIGASGLPFDHSDMRIGLVLARVFGKTA